ncbi:MAG: hypothetical protein FJW36_07995 [Acidobacteria bacterium]|nr:hypothetical protein [Acidobacteriota bacterium]
MKNWIVVALLGLLGVTGWLGWRAEQGRLAVAGRVARLEAELLKTGVVVPVEEPTQLLEKTPAVSPKQPSIVKDKVDVGNYLQMIDSLRAKTQELEKDIEEAREDAHNVKEKAEAQAEETRKLADQLASLREDLGKQQRVSDALDAELKFKAQRLVQSETAEKLLQEKLAKAELAAKRAVVANKEVEDLNRRREAAVVTLERRYREVTDLYRSFSLNLQTRENPGQGLQAGDLSRIQNALQQAEDELRQLRGLNARMAELARGK